MKCKKCGLVKNEDDFYRGDSTCKECRKEGVRANRKKNIEYYREFDRKRAMLPHRVAAREAYKKTDAGKKSIKKSQEKWKKNNLLKRAANVMVGNAVRDGKLLKPKKCSCCGKRSSMIHGHHDDYYKPLEVRWLCTNCHTKWHKENGEGKNG
jgi:hypothetical protein